MIEWWNNLDIVGQIYALVAIPSTLVLLIQTVLLLFGIGNGDMEADGLDFDGDELFDTSGDGGMMLISVRGIMAFAAIGGWSGLVMHESGINTVITVILSLAFGTLALFAVGYIMRLSMKLQSSGNINIGHAIGKVGTVYIPIPEKMSGMGKINLCLQDRFIEVSAMTAADRKLKTGETVRVVATDETGCVVVEAIADQIAKNNG